MVNDEIMAVLVCGDRNWTARLAIYRELDYLKIHSANLIKVVHGGCRGADLLAKSVAEELGMAVKEYIADWEKHGRAAGPIRNEKMLDEERPDLVLAFHSDIGHSLGTMDMIKRANLEGIPVKLIAR